MKLRVVIMGVSGCGKTTVGSGLATRLGISYCDGDDLHPPENVAKMRAGIALIDDDRLPWLDKVAEVLKSEAPIIVGCSALRRMYRDHIRARAEGSVQFVHLAGPRSLLAKRVAQRTGHYMPLSLLDSQIATLEPPDHHEAIIVNINQPIEAQVEMILQNLHECGQISRAE